MARKEEWMKETPYTKLPPRGTGLKAGRAGERRRGKPRTEEERRQRHEEYMEELEDRWHGGWAKGMAGWIQRLTPEKIDEETAKRVLGKLVTEADEEEWSTHLVGALGGLTPRQVIESSLTAEELEELGAPERLVELKRKQEAGVLEEERAKALAKIKGEQAKKKLEATV